jgi:exosortase/archaeosortase family protein
MSTVLSVDATAGPIAPRGGFRPSPAMVHLTLHMAALGSQARWMWTRMRDGSDDPLGAVAICTLLLIVARYAAALRRTPRPGWMLFATMLLLSASLAMLHLPPLLASLLGMLSLTAALAAWLPSGIARLPLAGLAVLALPLISSLQFYAGYPLRIVTAELSAWILRIAGVAAERSGASMTIQGQLVIIDAPCSGVQLAWMAYFCACTLAALRGLPDRAFLLRLPVVGLLVIAGNLVRNLVLVLLETRPGGLDDASHAAVGLAVLGGVCLLVLRWMKGTSLSAPRPEYVHAGIAADWPGWVCGLAPALIAGALLLRPSGQPISADSAPPAESQAEWPTLWDGEPLRPLALSAVERRFAQHFPGRIGRFDNGSRTVVLREVTEPTRRLHPAVDCYRGLGYRVDSPILERDAQRRIWRCFVAERAGQRLRVCEQLVDVDGQTYTDASAWYWNALLGQSRGPWLAVTRAEAL